MMVDLQAVVDIDPAEVGVTEQVYYPVLEKILEENDNLEDIKDAIKTRYPRSDSEAYHQRRYFGFH